MLVLDCGVATLLAFDLRLAVLGLKNGVRSVFGSDDGGALARSDGRGRGAWWQGRVRPFGASRLVLGRHHSSMLSEVPSG